MNQDLREPVKRRVGGTLAVLPPLVRLEALRKNARWLLGVKWNPPTNDGTYVRKTVGYPR